MTSTFIGYMVGVAGAWILQDALASIAFYPNECWKWNHTARMIRGIVGIALVILGCLLL